MKTIYFIRHAKSSWELITTDHDRMLNPRGFSDANIIGKFLKEKHIQVDRIHSSSANRAETTARIICENLGIPLDQIQTSKDLYDFDGKFVQEYINTLSDDDDSVMLFGHNPCFNRLVNNMGSEVFLSLPTCAVVGIEFKGNKWTDISEGKTVFSVFPKEIR